MSSPVLHDCTHTLSQHTWTTHARILCNENYTQCVCRSIGRVPGWTVRGDHHGRPSMDVEVPAAPRRRRLRYHRYIRPEANARRLERCWCPLQLQHEIYARWRWPEVSSDARTHGSGKSIEKRFTAHY